MKINLKFDEARSFSVELGKIEEKKVARSEFDGIRESNRIYRYYFIYKMNPENEGFLAYMSNDANNTEIEDVQFVRRNSGIFSLILLKSRNKYELDNLIDQHVEDMQSIFDNKIVQHSMKVDVCLTEDQEEFFEFLRK